MNFCLEIQLNPKSEWKIIDEEKTKIHADNIKSPDSDQICLFVIHAHMLNTLR